MHADDYSDDELDEAETTLLRALGDERRFSYEYDFGDGWEHEVVVEAASQAPRALKLAVCLGGENNCPPEDCGGTPGYADLLTVLADPSHEEHADLAESARLDRSTRLRSTSPRPTSRCSKCAELADPRVTQSPMADVTVRELRDRAAEVFDRVAAGEHLTVIRDGRPIAELRPLPRPRLRGEELLQRWSLLPHVDPHELQRDIARVVK